MSLRLKHRALLLAYRHRDQRCPTHHAAVSQYDWRQGCADANFCASYNLDGKQWYQCINYADRPAGTAWTTGGTYIEDGLWHLHFWRRVLTHIYVDPAADCQLYFERLGASGVRCCSTDYCNQPPEQRSLLPPAIRVASAANQSRPAMWAIVAAAVAGSLL
jgi:hypothetical protein